MTRRGDAHDDLISHLTRRGSDARQRGLKHVRRLGDQVSGHPSEVDDLDDPTPTQAREEPGKIVKHRLDEARDAALADSLIKRWGHEPATGAMATARSTLILWSKSVRAKLKDHGEWGGCAKISASRKG